MGTRTIRFFGTRGSLEAWGGRLREATLREPSAIGADRHGRCYFDVAMTTADREAMLAAWRSPCGRGESATGVPYRWNDCLTFVAIPAEA